MAAAVILTGALLFCFTLIRLRFFGEGRRADGLYSGFCCAPAHMASHLAEGQEALSRIHGVNPTRKDDRRRWRGMGGQ